MIFIFTTFPKITGAREYIIIVMATLESGKIVKYATHFSLAQELCLQTHIIREFRFSESAVD